MVNVFIHLTAEVSEGAQIGEGCKVWNQAQIREGAVLGKNCIISKNAYIDENVRIGDQVKIQNNVNIYHGVTIEDDVFLGPSMTFTNDMYPRAFNNGWKITETLVKRGASVGANATIRCGITIGEYAVVGAGSVVVKDVMPYELVAGNPAQRIGWVCRCGFKLDGTYTCTKCGSKYDFRNEE